MRRSIDIRLVKFYLWVGLANFLIGLHSALGEHGDRFFPMVFNRLWAVAYLLVFNFLLFEYVVPFVLRRRRTIIYNLLLGVLFLFVFMMLYSYGAYGWQLLGAVLNVYTPLRTFPTVNEALANQTEASMESVLFFGIIRHLYGHIKLIQREQQLRIEKQEAELNYLRSQTNPHFLFNTLNNIYALAKDKSELASESILQLSKILRFMLYETNGEYIAAETELKIIDDYIALEKLRYDESLRVNFNYDVEDLKQALPPLLLVPLVENAFKHGVSETRSQPFVDVHLSIRQRQLSFVVRNSSENYSEGAIKENIGLSNLRRQLEMLYKEYDLSVQQRGTVFTANLKINLASHV